MPNWLIRIWMLAKHRPFITCPFCDGKGGAMSGYYEPEWSECRECYPHWEPLTDCGPEWCVGRLPVWEWVRARISLAFGLWYIANIRTVIACRLGFHDWMNEDRMEPGLRICCVCYQSGHVSRDGKGVDVTEDAY